MLSLNIQFHSFELPKSIIDSGDKIRVSITTLPDRQKQAFTFEASRMNVAHPSFTINFSEITDEIVIVFRKINLFSDDRIFASTFIKSDDFPQLFKNINNIGMKVMNIYEPIQHNGNKNKAPENRKVLGKMLAQFYLTENFNRQNEIIGNKLNKINCQQKDSRIESFLKNDSQDMLFRGLISN